MMFLDKLGIEDSLIRSWIKMSIVPSTVAAYVNSFIDVRRAKPRP